VAGKYMFKIYAHFTKYHKLRILACMESYSATMAKAVLLVTLVSVPVCKVEGEFRLGVKPEGTITIYVFLYLYFIFHFLYPR
jgi:hypothetical protein